MSNPTALAAPKNALDKLNAAEINALDAGQQAALTRSGTTPLTGAAIIRGGGNLLTFDMTDNSASQVAFGLFNLDLVVTTTGTGGLALPGAALKLGLAGGGLPSYPAPLTVFRAQRAPAFRGGLPTDGFPWVIGKGGYNCTTGNAALYLPITNVVDLATLSVVTVTIFGGSGGGFVALPANMPTLAIWRLSSADGSLTQLGSTATDPSGTVTAYNAVHSFSITGLTEVANGVSPHSLYAIFTGPGGANYIAAETTYIGLRCTFTAPYLTPGG